MFGSHCFHGGIGLVLVMTAVVVLCNMLNPEGDKVIHSLIHSLIYSCTHTHTRTHAHTHTHAHTRTHTHHTHLASISSVCSSALGSEVTSILSMSGGTCCIWTLGECGRTRRLSITD